MNISQKFAAIHDLATRLEEKPKDAKLVVDLARRIKELSVFTHAPAARPRAAELHRLEIFELTDQATGSSKQLIGWDSLAKLTGIKESSLRVQFSYNGNEMLERVVREGRTATAYVIQRLRVHATPDERRAQDEAAASPPPTSKIRKSFAPGLKYDN